MRLMPTDPPACPESVEVVLEADWIVLGPGSWFTSVIPHLLVPQLAEAIHATAARRILTLNLEPADETAGFSRRPARRAAGRARPGPAAGRGAGRQRFAADDPHLPAWADSLGRRVSWWPTWPPATARPATIRSGWRRRTPRSWASELDGARLNGRFPRDVGATEANGMACICEWP